MSVEANQLERHVCRFGFYDGVTWWVLPNWWFLRPKPIQNNRDRNNNGHHECKKEHRQKHEHQYTFGTLLNSFQRSFFELLVVVFDRLPMPEHHRCDRASIADKKKRRKHQPQRLVPRVLN